MVNLDAMLYRNDKFIRVKVKIGDVIFSELVNTYMGGPVDVAAEFERVELVELENDLLLPCV